VGGREINTPPTGAAAVQGGLTRRTALKRAVFLDRDGVLNKGFIRNGKSYPPRCLEEFQILEGVSDGCLRLKKAGFLLIVVTNQPDVGRGSQSLSVVEEMHQLIRQSLPIDLIEVCFDETDTENFKPAPGMLFKAASRLSVDLYRSFMVGDRWRDIECGVAAGCTTVLVEYPYAEALRNEPDFRVASLLEAANLIVSLTENQHEFPLRS
jgi:D-glycero-D-manno-heptose 1,7-bisphosphate phosphatase